LVLEGNLETFQYKQLGYEEVGIQRKIGYANGKWVEVIILQLSFLGMCTYEILTIAILIQFRNFLSRKDRKEF